MPIRNALAQMLVRRVIREPFKLVLHRLAEVRIFYNGILRFFISKIWVEICYVQYGFLQRKIKLRIICAKAMWGTYNTGLERRLDFLCK
jgi:hypothetical protein